MTNTKMTKKDWFNEIKGIVESANRPDMEEMIKFIDHEVELLSKKKSSSNSKKNEELEALCIQLESALAEFDRPVTVTEFMKESTSKVATLSNQKISALLKKCCDLRGTVVKTTEKKKSYFALVVEDQGTGGIAPTPTF